jgi:uncharacterized surface protein with fasciclin (FAS1) repeats
MIERRPAWAFAGALAAAMLVTACNSDSDDAGEPTAQVSRETLATVVADADGLSVAANAMSDAGLAQVFDGAAAYTMLVPQDSAFEALGEPGQALRSPEQRAAMVAVLRDHIVPGYLTPEDIANAIDQADNGSVKMRTMGDHAVTFTQEGETITATSEDGSTAKFAGDALRASNGVAIPVDGVLKKVTAPAA